MTAPAAKIERDETNADTLRAYARDRARKVRSGESNLHDVVDRLHEYAVSRGLVAELGQDAVQAIMAEAFTAPMVPDLIEDMDDVEQSTIFADDQYEGLSSTFAAACRRADEEQARRPKAPPPQRLVARSTIEAAVHLLCHGCAEEFRAWLDQRGHTERAEILKKIEGRQCRN